MQETTKSNPYDDKININALIHLISHMQPDETKQRLLLDSIIKKYFEQRTTNPEFNLYKFIKDRFPLAPFHKQETNMHIHWSILRIESQNDNIATLPKTHQEDFLTVLATLSHHINTTPYDDSIIRTQDILTLLNSISSAINNIQTTAIQNPVMKKQINNLIEQLNTEKPLTSTSTNKTPSENIVKKLSIPKSKTTKAMLKDIFENFDLYTTKEKNDYIDIAIRKEWSCEFHNIPKKQAFKHFKDNNVNNRHANYFKILLDALNTINTETISNQNDDKLQEFLNYCEYTSFDELEIDMLTKYMQINGTTQAGAHNYIMQINNALYETNLQCANKVNDYIYEHVLLQTLDLVRPFKNATLYEAITTTIPDDTNNRLIFTDDPLSHNATPEFVHMHNKHEDLEITEQLQKNNGIFIDAEHNIAALMMSTLTIIGKYFCKYTGHHIANNKDIQCDKKYENEVIELISIINSIKIDGSMLVTLAQKIINDQYHPAHNQINTIRQYHNQINTIRQYVRNLFCNITITPSIALDFIGTKEKYCAFFIFTETTMHGALGSYNTPEKYLYEILAVCIDNFEFSKKEDRDLFFSYNIYKGIHRGNTHAYISENIDVYNKTKYDFSIFDKILEKLQTCPDIMHYVNEYMDVETQVMDILQFIVAYCDIKPITNIEIAKAIFIQKDPHTN